MTLKGLIGTVVIKQNYKLRKYILLCGRVFTQRMPGVISLIIVLKSVASEQNCEEHILTSD